MNIKEILDYAKAQPIVTEFLKPAKGNTFHCICDGCKSGSGEKGTGASIDPNGNRLHCFSCNGHFTNVDVFAYYLGISVTGNPISGQDAVAVAKFIAEHFGLTLDDNHGYKRHARKFSSRSQIKKETTMTATPTKTPTPVKEEKPKAKFDRLDEARANISKIVASGGGELTFRGLRLNLMAELGWGFLPAHHFQNNPQYSAAPAVIIPNDIGGVLARCVEGYFFDERGKDHFAPVGTTTIYLPSDSTDFILFVTEGALNSASAWQAVKSCERDDAPALGFVSTGGTPFKQQFIQWFTQHYPNPDARPRVAVAYDDDLKNDGRNPGQKAAAELIAGLIDEGVIAANVIIAGRAGKDLNDLLQSDGDAALGNMILDAVAGAQDALQICAKKIERRKTAATWEKDNGKIEPAELLRLEADAEYLQGLTVDKINSTVAGTAQTLRAVARCRYFDFYRDVAESFMARVEKAKTAAKELSKQAKPENPVDDSIQATAGISISKLDDKADKFAAEIGKTHKEYQKEYERQQKAKQYAEFESKLEATRAKNNEDADAVAENTTGKVFSDCPLDLHIPPRFEMDENGIYCGDDVVCSTPVVITKIFKSDDNEHVEIAVRDRISGTWKRRIFDSLTIADSRKILELSKTGITVISSTAKYLSEYLVRQRDFNGNDKIIPVQKLYDKPGWVDDDFKEFIYPNTDGVAMKPSFDYSAVFTVKGDRAEWIEMYRRVTAASTAARFIFGAALIAPLVKVLGIGNEWAHLVSDSGHGKTAGIKFAMSVFGNPAKFRMKFNSTPNSLESSALIFNDFPNYVEELQSASKKVRENLDEIVYNYEIGSTRGRCAKTGDLRQNQTFSGTRISSGEQTITREDSSGEGAFKRIVELQCDDVFDNDFAVEVHHFTNEHYGLVGREWIAVIKERADGIRALFKTYADSFRNTYPDAFPNHITCIAAIEVAGWYFDMYVLGSGRHDSIYGKTYREDAKIIFDSLPKRNSASNAARAIHDVAEFIAANPYNFKWLDTSTGELLKQDDDAPRVPKTYGYRLSTRGEGYAVLPSVLRNEILARYPNASAIIRGFSKAGYLIEGKSTKHQYQIKVRVDDKTPWVYQFKAEALFPDSDNGTDNKTTDDSATKKV